MSKIFGTAINCMDGRTQIPVLEWMKDRFSVDYVDMITEAGPIRFLSQDEENSTVISSIQQRVSISIRKHFSKTIAIVGHEGCFGNPVSKEQQIKDIQKSILVVKEWKLTQMVIGLWVGENEIIEEIK